jgi:hypothetical protein
VLKSIIIIGREINTRGVTEAAPAGAAAGGKGGGRGRGQGWPRRGRPVAGETEGERDVRERDGSEKGERRDKVEERFKIKNMTS